MCRFHALLFSRPISPMQCRLQTYQNIDGCNLDGVRSDASIFQNINEQLSQPILDGSRKQEIVPGHCQVFNVHVELFGVPWLAGRFHGISRFFRWT